MGMGNAFAGSHFPFAPVVCPRCAVSRPRVTLSPSRCPCCWAPAGPVMSAVTVRPKKVDIKHLRICYLHCAQPFLICDDDWPSLLRGQAHHLRRQFLPGGHLVPYLGGKLLRRF